MWRETERPVWSLSKGERQKRNLWRQTHPHHDLALPPGAGLKDRSWSISGCLPSLTLSTLPSVCWWGEAVFCVFGWASGETVVQIPWDGTPRGSGSGNWTGRIGRTLGHAGLGAIGYSIQETLNILLAVLHPALLPADLGAVITEAPSCGRGLLRGRAWVGDTGCSRTWVSSWSHWARDKETWPQGIWTNQNYPPWALSLATEIQIREDFCAALTIFWVLVKQNHVKWKT